MNLPQRDNAHFACAHCPEEFLAIVANTFTRVPIRESQIQHLFANILAFACCFQFA